MYAIFQDGGHQYTAEVGRKIMLELHKDDAGEALAEGVELEFGEVLLVSSEDGVKVGEPNVDGAKVYAKVVGEAKGPKLVFRWFRRRKNSRRKGGHRQRYTVVEITKIDG